ncbi:MAG TPA: hypothetical protein VKG44_11650, partial [Candidatus Baltobacteraceae bacterium]|nr:hypothetical protein [Candidatus Baltobacteraceae bacterium]
MSEIVTVFRAELGRKVRSRVFLLATAGGALMIAFIVAAPAIFSRLSLSSTKDVILAGPPALRAAVAMQWRDQKDFSVVASVARLPVPVTLAYLDAHKKAAAAIELSVKDRRLHLDVFPRDLAAYDDVEFRSLLPVELALAAGMSPAQAKQTLRIARTLHPLDEKFSDSKSATFAHAVAFGLIFILYFAIIIASQS